MSVNAANVGDLKFEHVGAKIKYKSQRGGLGS